MDKFLALLFVRGVLLPCGAWSWTEVRVKTARRTCKGAWTLRLELLSGFH